MPKVPESLERSCGIYCLMTRDIHTDLYQQQLPFGYASGGTTVAVLATGTKQREEKGIRTLNNRQGLSRPGATVLYDELESVQTKRENPERTGPGGRSPVVLRLTTCLPIHQLRSASTLSLSIHANNSLLL